MVKWRKMGLGGNLEGRFEASLIDSYVHPTVKQRGFEHWPSQAWWHPLQGGHPIFVVLLVVLLVCLLVVFVLFLQIIVIVLLAPVFLVPLMFSLFFFFLFFLLCLFLVVLSMFWNMKVHVCVHLRFATYTKRCMV